MKNFGMGGPGTRLTAALAAMLVAATAATPAHGQQPAEYPVKFVCGAYTDGAAFALGNYFTAINIRNPGEDTILTYEVAVALVDRPGALSVREMMPLPARRAVELDCRSIRRLLPEGVPPTGAFVTGFLTAWPALRELDVVAVYTVTQPGEGSVIALHTERVPPRRTR